MITDLFRSLDVDNVLLLFKRVLLDTSNLFTSNDPIKLMNCCEAIKALIFPFKFELVYVPHLPEILLDRVETPFIFMLGSGEGWRGSIASFVNNYLVNSQNLLYISVFFLLIIAFAYFYNSIAFDPIRQADQLRKQGGFIPGIRPGPQTESFLAKTVNRITLPGAMFVAFIAILPYIILWVGDVQSFPFAGTTVLIAVGVALELMRQIDSQLMQRNYEGFLK